MTKVIAIDGPAAAGKGTLAKRLAAHFGYDYLDTGALYRAVGLRVLELDDGSEGAALRAAESLNPASLADPAIRTETVGAMASKVAAIPAVRAALFDFQRRFAAEPPSGVGAVLDGRDIGTVICPHADAKLFVTASAQARADRRVQELRERGEDVDPEAILRDVITRDERDSVRAVAPLVPAEDAHLLDTTNLDIEAAFSAALRLVEPLISR